MPIMHLFKLENTVDPDQLASDEASSSGSTLFFMHMMNQNDMKLEFHKAYTIYKVPKVCLYQHKPFLDCIWQVSREPNFRGPGQLSIS